MNSKNNTFSIVESKDSYSNDILRVILHNYGFKDSSIFANNTYISGSTVLKIILHKNPKEFNDLDLYIQNGLSESECDKFICGLEQAGYFHNTSLKKKQSIKKCLTNSNIDDFNITPNHAYFSLKEHIDKIISLESKTKKCVDIIIMNKSIEELLCNTFDLDIVKNYIQIRQDLKVEIKSMNTKAIFMRKATITEAHFNNRILHNAYEFNNFIKRFIKYAKTYDIFIGEYELTHKKFFQIVEFIFKEIKKILNCVDYSNDYDLNKTNGKVLVSNTVYNFESFNGANGYNVVFKKLLVLFKTPEKYENMKNTIYNILKETKLEKDTNKSHCVIS